MKRFQIILLCIFLVGFIVSTPAVGAERIIKLGVIGPYTGSNARVGMEIKNTALMAFENIGYKIGDYKVKLVFIDSQYDPAKATSAYSEAAEKDGVQATLCTWSSSCTLALMDLAVKYSIPNIGCMGGAQSEIDKYNSDEKYKGLWMRGYGSLAEMALGYVDFLENSIQNGLWKPKNKKVACFALDTEWGRTVSASLKKGFTSRGWEVVSDDFFSVTQTDFYPLMAKYKKMDLAVIAGTTSTAPLTAAFTKQAAELGIKAVMINDGMGWIGEWYKLTGSASDYTLDMIPQFGSQASKEWAKTYEKKYGYKPGATASGLNYDNINLFIKVANRTFEKYGEIDKQKLHAVILDELCTSKLTYGADEGAILVKKFEYRPELGNVPVVGKDYWFLPIIQYVEGEGKVVYPPDISEVDPTFQK